jgi:hypothetical protein
MEREYLLLATRSDTQAGNSPSYMAAAEAMPSIADERPATS